MGKKLGHSHTHNAASGLAEDMYEAMMQQEEEEKAHRGGGGTKTQQKHKQMQVGAAPATAGAKKEESAKKNKAKIPNMSVVFTAKGTEIKLSQDGHFVATTKTESKSAPDSDQGQKREEGSNYSTYTDAYERTDEGTYTVDLPKKTITFALTKSLQTKTAKEVEMVEKWGNYGPEYTSKVEYADKDVLPSANGGWSCQLAVATHQEGEECLYQREVTGLQGLGWPGVKLDAKSEEAEESFTAKVDFKMVTATTTDEYAAFMALAGVEVNMEAVAKAQGQAKADAKAKYVAQRAEWFTNDYDYVIYRRLLLSDPENASRLRQEAIAGAEAKAELAFEAEYEKEHKVVV